MFPPPHTHTQIKAIVTKEGLRGLYAGYGAFLLRDLPFDAIEFVAYEQLRKAAANMLQRDPNPVEVSLVGAVAGGFTGACVCEWPWVCWRAGACVGGWSAKRTLFLLHRVGVTP